MQIATFDGVPFLHVLQHPHCIEGEGSKGSVGSLHKMAKCHTRS